MPQAVPSQAKPGAPQATQAQDVQRPPQETGDPEERGFLQESEVPEEQALSQEEEARLQAQARKHEQKVRRSRRTRVVLILVIIVLLAALGGLGYLGHTLLFDSHTEEPVLTDPSKIISTPIEDEKNTDKAVVSATTIPDLSGLFGLDVTEAQAFLGYDYILTKVERAKDEDNSKVEQLAVFVYQPHSSTGAPVGSFTMPSIYLSLDKNGKVIQVLYRSSFEALGYQSASFGSFIQTQDMLFNVLRAAGVTPASSFEFPSVTSEEYTVYVDPEADILRIWKEEYTFAGPSDSGSAPTTWQVKLSYDYGIAGVTLASNNRPDQRLITISLR